jgi:hypothetical protein
MLPKVEDPSNPTTVYEIAGQYNDGGTVPVIYGKYPDYVGTMPNRANFRLTAVKGNVYSFVISDRPAPYTVIAAANQIFFIDNGRVWNKTSSTVPVLPSSVANDPVLNGLKPDTRIFNITGTWPTFTISGTWPSFTGQGPNVAPFTLTGITGNIYKVVINGRPDTYVAANSNSGNAMLLYGITVSSRYTR